MRTHFILNTKCIIVFLLCGLLINCAPWPRNEYDKKTYFHYSKFHAERCEQKILYRELIAKKARLNQLRLQGARTCFPGRWKVAHQLATAINTEIGGLHFSSAMLDLKHLNRQLNELQYSLRYVNAPYNCHQKNLPHQVANQYREGW